MRCASDVYSFMKTSNIFLGQNELHRGQSVVFGGEGAVDPASPE
jgi:hypothetical protein